MTGERLDRRADVYSMGATLYYCLTGSLVPEAAERMYREGGQSGITLQLGGLAQLPFTAAAAIRAALELKVENRIPDMRILKAGLEGQDITAAAAALQSRSSQNMGYTSASQFSQNPGPAGYASASQFSQNPGPTGYTSASQFSQNPGPAGYASASQFSRSTGPTGYTAPGQFSQSTGPSGCTAQNGPLVTGGAGTAVGNGPEKPGGGNKKLLIAAAAVIAVIGIAGLALVTRKPAGGGLLPPDSLQERQDGTAGGESAETDGETSAGQVSGEEGQRVMGGQQNNMGGQQGGVGGQQGGMGGFLEGDSRFGSGETPYGADWLAWQDFCFYSDSEGIYVRDNADGTVEILETDAYAAGFYAEDSTVYYMKQPLSGDVNSVLCSYNMETGVISQLGSLAAGSRLVGKMDAYLVILSIDDDDAAGDSFVLQCYGFASGTLEELIYDRREVGDAAIWNGRVVFTSARSDAGPAELLTGELDEEGWLTETVLDEYGSRSFYVNGATLYYLSYLMLDETSWTEIVLTSAVYGQGEYPVTREFVAADADSVSILLADRESIVISVLSSADPQLYIVDALTGDFTAQSPLAGAIPEAFADGETTYWYADGALCIWNGSGYSRIDSAGLPAGAQVLGICGGEVYYRTSGTGRESGTSEAAVLTIR